MADTTDGTAAEATKETVPAEKKSYIRTLAAGNERLQFLALQGKNGVSTYSLLQEVTGEGKDKKTKTIKRGAAQTVATMAEGRAIVDKGIAAGIAAGWSNPPKAGGGGFKAKPDEFNINDLPKPKGASAAPAGEAATAAPAAPAKAPASAPKNKQKGAAPQGEAAKA